MATLGLNMIIAGGESELLRRCLTSVDAQNTFDEIVIVNTSTDVSIDQTATEFGARVFTHQWASDKHPYGDFAGARNCALMNSTSDYVMWLDTDDVVQEKFQPGLKRLKDMLDDTSQPGSDLYYIPYAVKHDADLNPVSTLYRDRLFKRTNEVRWMWPVHEILHTGKNQPSSTQIDFLQISHLPIKTGHTSSTRNIRILRHEIEANNSNVFHLRYFLARDLATHGDLDEAASIADTLLAEFPGQESIMHSLCMTLAFNFAYGGLRTCPALDEFSLEQSSTIEHWLKAAIRCYQQNAEPYFLLGELYNRSGNQAQAEQMYVKAMEQPVKAGMLQATALYAELPAQRLADIYVKVGRLEHALWMNRRALQANKASETARAQRRAILDTLNNEDI